MIAYWRAEGNATDLVGSHDGTLVGGTAFTDGFCGTAFSFATAGANDYVSVPSSSDFNLGTGDNKTFAFWWKANSLPASESGLITRRDSSDSSRGLHFSLAKNGATNVYYLHLQVNHWLQFTPGYAAGQWYHVAVTKSGTTWKVYHNGAELSVWQSYGWPFTGNATKNVPLLLGKDTLVSGSLDGSMDEIAVFNTSLNAAEVLALYQSSCHYCDDAPTATPTAALPTTPTPSPAPTPLCPESMIAYWQAEGDATDYVGSHDGSLVGAAAFTDGVCETAFSFAAYGGNDYVSVPSSSDFNLAAGDNRSFAFWWKANSLPTSETGLITRRDRIDSDRGLHFSLAKNGATAVYYLHLQVNHWLQFTPGYAAGQWYHVAVTKSGTTWKVYHNGAELPVWQSTGWPYTDDATKNLPLLLGKDTLVSGSLDGSMDEIAVFNQALSAAEVLDLYQSSCHYCDSGAAATPTAAPTPPPGPTPMCPNSMIAYWQAEGDATDYVGYHDGSLVGPTDFTDGVCETAFSFAAPGGNDYVSVPSSSDFNLAAGDDKSFAFWWKAHSISGSETGLISRRDSADADRGLHFSLATNSGTNVYYLHLQVNRWIKYAPGYVAGQWYNVVVTKEGTTWKVYHNGAELPVWQSTGWPFTGNATKDAPLLLGKDTLVSGSLDGSMDEIAVFNQALSAAEVLDLYQSSCHYCPSGESTPTPPPGPTPPNTPPPQPTCTAAPPTPSPSPTPLEPLLDALANPTAGNAPLTVDFDGTLIQGGCISAYRWDFDDDGTWDYISSQSLKTSHTFGSTGTYLSVCSVVDALGRYAYDSVIIQVSDPAQPPVVEAAATPGSGAAPLDVTFGGSVQSSRPIVLYLWDYDGNGVVDWGSDQTAATAYTFGAPGYYTSRLSVVDDSGLMASDTVYIQVDAGATPPQVDAFAYPASGTVPLKVGFSGIVTPPGGIALYEWDFDGDGAFDWSSQSDGSASHVFSVSGDYEARLRATDASGLYGEDTITITAFAPSELKVWISVPKDGWTVSGDAVSVRMNTAPGVLTKWVQAQYRPTGEGEWIDLGSAIEPPPYSFDYTWDTATLPPGSYQLRAKASDTSEAVVYSESITVQVVAADGQADEGIDPDGDHVKRQEALTGESAVLEIAGGLTLTLPYGALGGDATAVLSSLSDNPQSGRRSRSATALFSFATVSVEGVAGLLKPGVLSIPYADAHGDGIVDGTSVNEGDLAIFRYDASAGEWQAVQESTVYWDENFVCAQVMATGDYALGTVVNLPTRLILHSGDYNGDGLADAAVFRASSGLWASPSGERVYLGAAGDIPVSGDYDGDGTAERALFRSSTGLWVAEGLARFYLGASGDAGVPGDYNGDGTCEKGIFRSSNGLWSIPGITRAYLGSSNDQAVPADYSGDGRAEIGIFRSANGFWSIAGVTRTYLGADGDIPIPADYDGEAGAEIAIFRLTNGLWSIPGFDRFYFGSLADIPIPAGFREGPESAALFRPSSGMWVVRLWTRFYFGSSGDLPVTR
jgi:PKD repeat protein